MGYGGYSAAAHRQLVETRQTHPVKPSVRVDALLDPKDARRESRDSDAHPHSTAVLFVLDVTASMGRIPSILANETLPGFMSELTTAGIEHAQVGFMAVGHAGTEAMPIQVGQFESTAHLIDDWLTRLRLSGGGNRGQESYELAMWFAANRTSLDCVEKRGRRGLLFLTADTAPNPAVSRIELQRVMGETVAADIPIRELVETLQRTWEPFVLLAPGTPHRAIRAWRDLFGDRVVEIEHVDDVAAVASGLVALLEGAVGSLREIGARLMERSGDRRTTGRRVRALTGVAASLERDGAPLVDRSQTRLRLPPGNMDSGMIR